MKLKLKLHYEEPAENYTGERMYAKKTKTQTQKEKNECRIYMKRRYKTTDEKNGKKS